MFSPSSSPSSSPSPSPSPSSSFALIFQTIVLFLLFSLSFLLPFSLYFFFLLKQFFNFNILCTVGGKRSDAGLLGNGLYFARDPNISLQYTKPSSCGNLYLFVAEVALGSQFLTHEPMIGINHPPKV
jgi:hypothetical protein